jgi:IS5 family transposase
VELAALIQPQAPKGRGGRPPLPIETILRIGFLQQWFGLSKNTTQITTLFAPSN